jgi:hypothetical protein
MDKKNASPRTCARLRPPPVGQEREGQEKRAKRKGLTSLSRRTALNPSSSSLLPLPLPSTTTAKLSVESKSECAALATQMRAGPCAGLQAATQAHTSDILAMECPAVIAFQAQMPVASEDCCVQMRSFITMGCACDEDVGELVQLGGGTPADLAAALKMAQAGSCADAAHGGPIMDPCTNDVGCRGAV